MKNLTGIEGRSIKTVKDTDTALFLGSGDLEVFATPAVVAFIEYTCKNSVIQGLDRDDTTVGIKIDVDHLKATVPGKKVTCISKVTSHEGKIIEFISEVYEGEVLIAKASHKRAVVNIERFLSKLK